MKLPDENSQLREKLELLQVVPPMPTEQEIPRTRILLSRTSPDGQEYTDNQLYYTEEELEKLIRAI